MKKLATPALISLTSLFASAGALAAQGAQDIIVQRPIIVQLLGLLGL